MLDFNKSRFLKTEQGAVKLITPLSNLIDELFKEGKISNVFFIGTGGVGILFDSTIDFLKKNSRFPVFREVSSEFMLAPNKNFSSNSVVFIPSLSGTTKETLHLADFCNQQGATTVSLVGSPDTPLEEKTNYSFYNDCLDDTSSENYYIQGLIIALRIMVNTKELSSSQFEKITNEFSKIPETLISVKEKAEVNAKDFVSKYGDENYHIMTGAGDSWAETYYFGMCILEEMQWIKTRPVHAADFFHGTLELLEKNVSIIVVQGEDKSRKITERVLNFIPKVTNKITVIDTHDYDTKDLSRNVRKIISPIILSTVFERYSKYLADYRKHPLEVRRYYRRMNY
jgi:fructoselysine-6-phosphate deglycase